MKLDTWQTMGWTNEKVISSLSGSVIIIVLMTMEQGFSHGGEWRTSVQLEGYQPNLSLVAIGPDAGNGHFGQAKGVADALTRLGLPCDSREFTGWVTPYATPVEKKVLAAWDWFTRVGLTQSLASKLSWVSYDVINAISKKYPAQTQMREIETNLTGLFARVLRESPFKGFIATHPAMGRMGLQAKSDRLLPLTYPIFSVDCDVLVEASSIPLVNEIYQYQLGEGNDVGSHNYVLVAGHTAAEKFVSGGYPREVVQAVGNKFELSDKEGAVVLKKQEYLEGIFRSQRLPEDNPPIFSVVQDNFETIPERLIVENLIRSYAGELAHRKLIFALLMTEADEYRVRKLIKRQPIPESYIRTIQNARDLEEFLTQPQKYNESIIFVRKYRDRKENISLRERAEFTDMQRLLELYSHAVFTRPSEVPRDAANYGTPSFLVFPYGPVEVNIGKKAQEDGFALPWATVDRSISSALHCARLGLPRLDLTDPYTYKELLNMSRRALESPMRQPLGGIVETIFHIAQNQIQIQRVS